MTQINSNSIQTILQEALHKDGDFLKEIVRRIIQQMMEEERDQQVGVLSHQRDDVKRKANRNGYKPRSFNTRVGNLLLAKPQIREFSFHTCLFENYQRSEKALLSAICQMVTDGVSTNRVQKIVGKLSPDLCYAKSTVSRITRELDPQIKDWREGQLKDHYVYLFTDAVYFFLRENHQVVSRPVLITVGLDKNGRRKILGVDIALEESYVNYRDHFKTLKEKWSEPLRLDTLSLNTPYIPENYSLPITSRIPREADSPKRNATSSYYTHLQQNRESFLLHQKRFHIPIDTPPPVSRF